MLEYFRAAAAGQSVPGQSAIARVSLILTDCSLPRDRHLSVLTCAPASQQSRGKTVLYNSMVIANYRTVLIVRFNKNLKWIVDENDLDTISKKF